MSVSTAVLCDRLRERWVRRFPEAAAVGPDVVVRYADPARVYHDVQHLSDVLAVVDLLSSECLDARAVELAGWFHDAVYDVHGSGNEAASADLARALLAPYLDKVLLAEVVRLVLLTRDHAVQEGDLNGAALCDADLAVLAGTPDRYDEYVARVRREFAALPDEAFRAGRADVLRSLLALPHLFHTRRGRMSWEAPARANLKRELSSLLP